MFFSIFASKSADDIYTKSTNIIKSNTVFIKVYIGLFLLQVALVYFTDAAPLWLLLGFFLGHLQGLLRCQYLVEFIKRNDSSQ